MAPSGNIKGIKSTLENKLIDLVLVNGVHIIGNGVENPVCGESNQRVHIDRAAGCHRYYCDTGGPFASGVGIG